MKPVLNLLKTAILASCGFAIVAPAFAENWDVSLWGKRRAFTEHVEKIAELVSAKTNGEFTLTLSYGGLSGNKENLDGISIGAFQMAQFCAGYHADKNPSITVLELPFLGVDSLEKEVAVSQALYTHPAVIADLKRWNAVLLMPSPLPQYNIMGVGDAPKTLADYKGLAVRATGGIGKALATIEAVPTSMSASEVRQSLDSGVVKAVSFAPHAHMSFGVADVSNWWTTNLNPGTVHCPIVVNQDALDGLSSAHREALLGSVDEALDHYVSNYNTKTMDKWNALLGQGKIEQVTYTESELAAFKQAAAEPIHQAWIKENSARGLPAQDLYDFVTAKIAE